MEIKRKRILSILRNIRENLVMTHRERNILLFVVVSYLVGNFLLLYQKFVGSSEESKIQKILVANKKAREKTSTEIEKIDINTANLEDLVKLPGIGVHKAQNILETRKKLGGFKSYDDLLKVKGIGPKLLEGIKPYISIE